MRQLFTSIFFIAEEPKSKSFIDQKIEKQLMTTSYSDPPYLFYVLLIQQKRNENTKKKNKKKNSKTSTVMLSAIFVKFYFCV